MSEEDDALRKLKRLIQNEARVQEVMEAISARKGREWADLAMDVAVFSTELRVLQRASQLPVSVFKMLTGNTVGFVAMYFHDRAQKLRPNNIQHGEECKACAEVVQDALMIEKTSGDGI